MLDHVGSRRRKARGRTRLRCLAFAVGLFVAILPPARAESLAFEDGLRDRASIEGWLAHQVYDTRDGAQFWAGQRSLAAPKVCGEQPMSLNWRAGCAESLVRFAPFDVRRRTEPDYRRGWNSWRGPATVAPQARADLPTAPVAMPAGLSLSASSYLTNGGCRILLQVTNRLRHDLVEMTVLTSTIAGDVVFPGSFSFYGVPPGLRQFQFAYIPMPVCASQIRLVVQQIARCSADIIEAEACVRAVESGTPLGDGNGVRGVPVEISARARALPAN